MFLVILIQILNLGFVSVSSGKVEYSASIGFYHQNDDKYYCIRLLIHLNNIKLGFIIISCDFSEILILKILINLSATTDLYSLWVECIKILL